MKVVKPSKLSVVTRCFEHNRCHHLGVSVLAFVPLTGPANLLSEIAMWTFVPERLAMPVLDAGVPKYRGEYLVDGYAYTPGGEPQPGVAIRARVGACEKILEVRGDRFWRGLEPTEPRPFAAMRLGWEATYGGPDFADNPLGKGAAEVMIEGVMIRPLPNVEYPGQLVGSSRDRPEPACMLPIDISWPQRQRYAGTYDQRWLETLFPGLAADVDWNLFNIAARDQQRDGWWLPGEKFRFDNMHPTRPVLEGELPRYVARAFINRKVRIDRLDERGRATGEVDERERFSEVPLALQTLWFFPDAERAVMIFQGAARIREADGADVLALVLAAEHEGQLRPAEHYRQALLDRMTGAEGASIAWLRETDLLPEDLPNSVEPALAEDIEIGRNDALLQKNMHNRAVREAERARAMLVGLGLDPDVHGPPIPDPPTPPPSPAEALQIAAKLQAEAEAKVAAEKQWAAERMTAIGAMIDELGIPGFTSEILRQEVESPAPVGPPTFTAAGQLASIQAMAADFRSRGTIVDELEEMSVDKQLYARWEAAERQMRDGYRISAHLQHPAPAMDEALHAAARERVLKAIARGEDFAEFNLTGADLSGMQLVGAKLAGGFFESARFDGADLSNADLSNAVLAHASLVGAKLDGAKLDSANLGRSTLRDASLIAADLSNAVLMEADLSGATVRKAKLSGVNLHNAKFANTDACEIDAEQLNLIETRIAGIRLAGAKLGKANFIKLDLSNVDFSGADLSSATFLGCVATGANFSGAVLVNARFVQACVLDQANFTGANVTRGFLRGSSMRSCELSHATLDFADLCECQLVSARFYRAIARETKFDKSDLSHAVLLSANLMCASFANATIRGADLRASNLYAADMARVRSDEHVQLDEALLTKVQIHPRYDPRNDGEPEDTHGNAL